MSEARALPSLLLYPPSCLAGGRAVSLTHNAESRIHTVHETRHLCWLQLMWGQNHRCYFYVCIDRRGPGCSTESRYQKETGPWSPCLLLGAADVRRSTYGKGCNSKFVYAFSGFMNPRLSAAMLCCPPTAPSPPIQNKNLEGLRMQWPGRVGITLSAWYSSERVPPASLSLVPPYLRTLAEPPLLFFHLSLALFSCCIVA